MGKKTLEELALRLIEVLSRLDSIEKRLDKLEKSSGAQESPKASRVEFHSLSVAEAAQALKKELEEKRKKAEPKLDKAADLAILHFRKIPPKRNPVVKE